MGQWLKSVPKWVHGFHGRRRRPNTNAPDCLTSVQVTMAQELYAYLTVPSSDELIFPGAHRGSEYEWANTEFDCDYARYLTECHFVVLGHS